MDIDSWTNYEMRPHSDLVMSYTSGQPPSIGHVMQMVVSEPSGGSQMYSDGQLPSVNDVGRREPSQSEPSCNQHDYEGPDAGIATFEMEYELWIGEQRKRDDDLRKVLVTHTSDIELRMLVESGLNHYYDLFRMKADAAKFDVVYMLNGLWLTPVERFYQWISGFRPSELLYIMIPQIELTDRQLVNALTLRHSCEQAEEALSQGMEKVQRTLAQSITTDITGAGSYTTNCALERLEALESFLNQADYLRQQTLQQMYRILTLPQAAKALLAIGEYFQRLRVLSSIWSGRPHDRASLLA